MLRLLFVVLSVFVFGTAKAGPPLVTDDPGTADPGTWEFLPYATVASSDSGESYEFPAAELTYGAAPGVDMTLILPHVLTDPDTGDSESGFGNPTFEVKWLFVDSAELLLAVAPSVTVGLSDSDADKGLGDSQDSFNLPLLGEVPLGEQWRMFGSFTYVLVSGADDAVEYGLAVTRPVGQGADFLFEFSGSAEDDFGEAFLDARVGFTVGISERLTVLTAVGTGLVEPSGAESLDIDGYLGLVIAL